MEFSKFPQHVHAGQYLTAADISSANVERFLRSQKSTSPGTDGLLGPVEIHEVTEAVNSVIFGICREYREFPKMP
jgi:hypothetical protein